MKVGTLRELLEGVDDELKVVAQIDSMETRRGVSGVWIRGVDGGEDVVVLVASYKA